MVYLHGEVLNFALFTDGDSAVVVDKRTNMIEQIGAIDDLCSQVPWDRNLRESTDVHLELATGALHDLSIRTIVASGRMYTIPKSVQSEAKKALEWRKKHRRGGTPVGLNTARTLARGGQIGIKKVRHIARYFPRHEVDKKGKGYKPGTDNFPSNGRIAWGLWGGDAAWRWSKSIVERENNKKSSTASAAYGKYDADISAFVVAKKLSGESDCPEFAARVRLDGTGIDRLYMIDYLGNVSVWDDGVWDDLGSVDGDIATYDRVLDDPYDQVEKRHILIDPDSALVLSAHLQERPFDAVHVEDLDRDETELVASAIDHVDWGVVDSALVAAGEEPLSGGKSKDGVYTPEERAENASKQVRDKTGKFAKTGSRASVGGKGGTITGINPAAGTIKMQMDGGGEIEVPGNQVGPPEEVVPVTDSGGQADWKSRTKLDTSGVLAEPRAPIDRPEAYIKGGLPALRSEDVSRIISDFPGWVAEQRATATSSTSTPTSPTSTSAPALHKAGDYAPEYEKSDYLTDLESKTGTSLWTDSALYHPMLQDFFNRDPMNALYYQPITSAAAPAPAEAEEKPKTAKEAAESAPKEKGTPLDPDTSDVQPMYLALVSPDDPAAVMDLVSVVPATTTSTTPVVFKRQDGEWVRDDQIMSDLTSATPPPVVPLTGEVYKDVLKQVDETMTASAYVATEMSALFASYETAVLYPMIAAGGIDRNRGKAEKLRRYWLFGRGALKIRWNTPGDWTRCYRHLRKYMGPRAKGYCSLRHKEATGVWPGSKYNVGKRNLSIADRYSIVDEDVVVDFARRRAMIADARSRVVVASVDTDEIQASGAKFKIPLVIPEGVETGDGRVFKTGSINLRILPLPLLWQIKTGDGHDGSVVVGRIDGMERVSGGIGNAYGVFDTGPYGREAERLVRERFINGVSADLDKFEADEEDDDDDDDDIDIDIDDMIEEIESGEDEDDESSKSKDLKKVKVKKKKKKKISNSKINVSKARVMAVTIVPKPAFEQCKIYIDDSAEQSQESTMPIVPDGVYAEQLNSLEEQAMVACGLVADAIPVAPPDEWFENPKLTGPTPLTVDDSGRVYGHIAAWNVDHIGMSFGTRPPRSKSNYAYFHTGVVRSAGGKDYPVGQLTLSGGHASLEASAVDAARHYDDTGSGIADVRAGEDAHGIWVAGALRPGTTPEQVRVLRASAPSGDWRPIKGSLELVAVCQVNVPGFPIARARVASGQVYALVAAGAMQLARMKTDPLQELVQRLEKVEERVGLSVLDQMKKAKSEASIDTRLQELSSRVRGDVAYDELGYISTKTRDKLAKEGKALPDGSYPIRNVAELKDAIQAYGRSKPGKRAAVRRHIIKRARALKKADLIPEKWKTAGLIDDEVVDDIKARVASAQKNLQGDSDPKG